MALRNARSVGRRQVINDHRCVRRLIRALPVFITFCTSASQNAFPFFGGCVAMCRRAGLHCRSSPAGLSRSRGLPGRSPLARADVGRHARLLTRVTRRSTVRLPPFGARCHCPRVRPHSVSRPAPRAPPLPFPVLPACAVPAPPPRPPPPASASAAPLPVAPPPLSPPPGSRFPPGALRESVRLHSVSACPHLTARAFDVPGPRLAPPGSRRSRRHHLAVGARRRFTRLSRLRRPHLHAPSAPPLAALFSAPFHRVPIAPLASPAPRIGPLPCPRIYARLFRLFKSSRRGFTCPHLRSIVLSPLYHTLVYPLYASLRRSCLRPLSLTHAPIHRSTFLPPLPAPTPPRASPAPPHCTSSLHIHIYSFPPHTSHILPRILLLLAHHRPHSPPLLYAARPTTPITPHARLRTAFKILL